MENPNEPTLVAEDGQPQEPPESLGATEPTAEAGAEGETAPTETPSERSYSKEEWSKRESAVQKQVEEAKRQAQEAIAKANQESKEAIKRYQDQQDQLFLQRVESEGGDVDAAKRLLEREQVIRKRESDYTERETRFQAEAAQAYEIAKRNDAERLAREHGLKDIDPLMTAENPTEMENIALKLALESSKVGAKKAVKTDTNIPTAKGADWSKLSPQEKVLQGLDDVFKD